MRRLAANPTAPTPRAFRERLLIDCNGVATRFQPDIWQEADFRALDAAWEAVIGQTAPKLSTVRKLWSERPRGHSKTTDQGVMCAYGLLYAATRIRIVAAAADANQAELLARALCTLARVNGWMGDTLEFQNRLVRNKATGSTLEILSSDAGTSYGLLPDVVVADEVSNWRTPDLFHSLISASAKRANCIFIAILNAGFRESWTWKVREAIRTDATWHFTSLPASCASWISPQALAGQKRILPATVYSRLWENQWSSGSGDALSDDDLMAAVDLHGLIDPTRADHVLVGGLDLGIKRDRSAFCVLGIDSIGHAYLVGLKVWQPGFVAGLLGKRTVDLAAVESYVADSCQRWGLASVFADVWQAEQLCQNLQRLGLPVEPIAQTPAVLSEMATTLIEKFTDRSVHLFDDSRLLTELRQLRLLDRPGGFRLDSPRGPSGHGDVASAFLLALLAGKRLHGVGGFFWLLERRDRSRWPTCDRHAC
jgi:phage terminase large subunit-like protein